MLEYPIKSRHFYCLRRIDKLNIDGEAGVQKERIGGRSRCGLEVCGLQWLILVKCPCGEGG